MNPIVSKINAAADMAGIPRSWLHAIVWKESNYDPKAYNPEDGKDPSYGLTQIRASTAAGYGVKDPKDLWDVDRHLAVAVKHIQFLKRSIEAVKPRMSIIDLAYAWNAGIGRWKDWATTGRPVPASTRVYALEVALRSMQHGMADYLNAFMPLLLPTLALLGIKVLTDTKDESGKRTAQTHP